VSLKRCHPPTKRDYSQKPGRTFKKGRNLKVRLKKTQEGNIRFGGLQILPTPVSNIIRIPFPPQTDGILGLRIKPWWILS